MAASSLPSPSEDDRSPSELVEELFAAYDYDQDGVLCFEELADFRADTTGQQLSQSMFSEFLTLPDSSNATRTAGQKQGFSRGQMVTLYEESQDSQRALGKDHARALEPSLDSWSSIGFAAIVTLQLGRALRRALRRSLSPLQSVPTGGARQVKADVGRGPARVRAGWLAQPSASEELPPPGRKLPPLTFIDLTGSTDVAAGLRDGGPQRKDTAADTDDFELFPPRLGSRNWPEGGAGDGVGGSAAEEDSVFGLGSLLGAIRSIWPGAKASEVSPPLAKPPIPLRGSLGTLTGDATDPKKGTARERAEEVKRQMLQQLARLSMPVPEPKDNLDNDVSRAYKSVRDFKVLKEEDPSFVKMEDFRGSPDVKKQLVELVEMLQKPERYAEVGAKPPKGVLMCGEPGTGKTFAARAVASEAGVPFLAISGSDFRQSPFSGVGTSMTLKMLDEARKKAPCIIFIDEIDSLGEARRQGPTAFQDAGEMGGSVTRDQDANLNALLAKMDGVQPTAGVLFLAATNRPEVLDEALLRTGRFDMRIEFKLPDASSREEILRGCSGGLKFVQGEDLDIPSLAKQTPAFSPADLQGLMNSAALAAARADRSGISTADVQASLAALKKQKAKARPEGSFQVTNCVDVSFSQVRGHDEAVEELRDLIDALVDREKYSKVGAVPPRGVLLEGPPGVGKTHCAKAIAGEVGLPFLSASGSDFQASRYAGQGTQVVKRLFALARKLQPCVLFIDEVDALGRRRSASPVGAEQDRENTMMQLLVELDGFEERSETLVLAATNQAEVLDEALLRPGRLDRRVVLEPPDQNGRLALLELYSDGKPLDEDVDLGQVARRTVGFNGADIKNLINEAALLAAKRKLSRISSACVFTAADRVSLGIEKANPLLSQEARRLTAVHEAGHAVLGLAFSSLTQRRVARASIRPRTGGVGGVTIFEPMEEGAEGVLPLGIVTKQAALASLCVELGGRVAEEVLLQPLEVSSGASMDLRTATSRAMAMVTEWGLVDPDSVLSIGALGSRCSDATLHQAEQKASRVLSQALASARALAQECRESLELVAQRLEEGEELQAEELTAEPLSLAALRDAAQRQAATWVDVS